jgi:hypothetical protein
MGARDGTVSPADQFGRGRKIPPPVIFPAVIRVAGVKIHARGKSITSRGQNIFAAGDLEATPASRNSFPLAHRCG